MTTDRDKFEALMDEFPLQGELSEEEKRLVQEHIESNAEDRRAWEVLAYYRDNPQPHYRSVDQIALVEATLAKTSSASGRWWSLLGGVAATAALAYGLLLFVAPEPVAPPEPGFSPTLGPGNRHPPGIPSLGPILEPRNNT